MYTKGKAIVSSISVRYESGIVEMDIPETENRVGELLSAADGMTTEEAVRYLEYGLEMESALKLVKKYFDDLASLQYKGKHLEVPVSSVLAKMKLESKEEQYKEGMFRQAVEDNARQLEIEKQREEANHER